jgi:phosphate uptake regulator
MVALPKKWVREMGLRQGSEIMITRPSLTSLLINADPVAVPNIKREAIIEVSEKDSAEGLFRKIVSLYIQGYSLISLRTANGSLSALKRDRIKEMVRKHLIGTEGVSDSKDKMSIHVLLGYSELSAENALKKMLVIATSMQKDALLALENHDKAVAAGVIERDDEVDRFGLYVIRQLNVSIRQGVFKETLLDPQDVLGYTLVVRTLQRIADHSSRICEQVMNAEAPLRKVAVGKLVAMGEFSLNMVDSAMLSLFKRDHVGADLLFERKKQFFEMSKSVRESLDLKSAPDDSYSVQVTLESLGRIVEYAGDIAEVVLDLTIERVVKQE